MRVKKLFVKNFRNHRVYDLSPGEKINFLTGRNGAGKTALLEACALALTGRSFRQGKEWIRKGENQGLIALDFECSDGPGRILVQLSKDGPPQIFINEKKKSSRPFRHLCIFFLPESLAALRGDASHRRHLADDLSAWNSPSAARAFQKILNQRNKFLKSQKQGFYSNKDSVNYQTAVDESFTAGALALVESRLRALEEFKPFWKKRVLQILKTNQAEVKYLGSSGRILETLAQAKDELKEERKKKDFLEKLYGASLFGPHRHDLLFLCYGLEARGSLSYGQQKALILSWKMAQGDFVRYKTKEEPLYFLDDVFSEIDPHFKKNLIDFFLKNKAQSFLASPEGKSFFCFKSTKIFLLGEEVERNNELSQ